MYIDWAEEPSSVALYDWYYSLPDNNNQRPETTEGYKGHRPTNRSRLGKESDKYSTIDQRNALLIVMVYLHARYVLPFKLLLMLDSDINVDSDHLALASALKKLSEQYGVKLSKTVQLGLKDLAKKIGEKQNLTMAIDHLNREAAWPTIDSNEYFGRLLGQYIDPAPKPSDKVKGPLRHATRIGTALQRLLDSDDIDQGGTPKRSKRLEGILRDTRCLDRERLYVARVYAQEVLPPPSIVEWPVWLSPIGDLNREDADTGENPWAPLLPEPRK
jgi:hypothetical protein